MFSQYSRNTVGAPWTVKLKSQDHNFRKSHVKKDNTRKKHCFCLTEKKKCFCEMIQPKQGTKFK